MKFDAEELAKEIVRDLANVAAINTVIKQYNVDTNQISDGYHTFGELYDHRITLFIALCSVHERYCEGLGTGGDCWRSLSHSDGSVWEGWFLLGIGKKPGEQITYHLPIERWGECDFAQTLERAPEFDGHNATDVLKRLKAL